MTDTREETKLLPCPFCGSEAVLSVSRDGDVCNVRCSEWSPGKCLGAGPNTYSEGKAIEAWNTRATEAAPSEPLDDKLVYIKPLRTLVRVQTMYADQVRDLCNAPAAPSEPVADDVCRLVIAARIVAFEDQSADALRELDKASEAFADRVKWGDEPPAQPDTTKSGSEG